MATPRYPNQTVQAAPGMETRSSFSRNPRTARETQFLPDLQFARRSMAVLAQKRKTDDVLEEYLPIERTYDFFLSNDTKRLGPNIFVRKAHVPTKGQDFIFWMKQNFSEDPNVDNTFLCVSSYELPRLVECLDILITEISETSPRKLVQRLALSADSIVDSKDDPRFWSPDFTMTLESETLKIRQYRDKTGTYQIRFWSPRSNQKWIGPSMSIAYGLAKDFLELLKTYQLELDTEMIRKEIDFKSSYKIPKITMQNLSPEIDSPESPLLSPKQEGDEEGEDQGDLGRPMDFIGKE